MAISNKQKKRGAECEQPLQQLNKVDYSRDYILALETTQSNNIKILFEVIKEVLKKDINLIFTPEYIKIEEIEGTEKCMVYLELDTVNTFEEYYCEKKIVVGINADNFYKIIKTSKGADTIISFFITKENPDIFTVKLENSDKGKIYKSNIKILDIPYESLEIPDQNYPDELMLLSQDFQKICRDINSTIVSNGSFPRIEITNIGQQIIFSYEGEFSHNEIIFGKNDQETSNHQIIQGVFNLKFLLLFTKATNLSSHVKIYMNNNSALILKYGVGTLGSIRFILTYEED